MKIYTRTGDTGETALFGAGRVSKAAPRVAAYGDIDELNAVLGVALTAIADADIGARLALVQADLFTLGAHLATPPVEGRRAPAIPPLPTGRVAEFETWMDEAEAKLPELKAFVMPGGSPGGAALHHARTVCRRAERAVVRLAATERVDDVVLRYLNRLSDLLFVLARLENAGRGVEERQWHPPKA